MKTEATLNVLYLEDSERDFEIIQEQLTGAGYDLNISRVEREDEFTMLISKNKYDIILADFNLPGFDGFAALRWAVEICPDVPFICISGTIGEEAAVKLLKTGAVDYVMKDKLKRLPGVIKRALDEANDKKARRLAEKALLDSEQRYRTLVTFSPDSVYVHVDDLISLVNPAFCKLLGADDPSQLIGKSIFEIIHPDYHEIVKERVHLVSKGQPASLLDEKFIRLDGTIVDVEVNAIAIDWQGSRGTQVIVRDITGRKQSEMKILQLNRMYAILSNINQLILRERDKQKLYEGACKIAVDEGKFLMAWIGISDKSSPKVEPVAGAGTPDGYLEQLHITTSDIPEGKGPTGTAIRECHSVICNDIEHNESTIPWREQALALGYKSSAAFPIIVASRAIGALNLYSDAKHFFDKEEISLLEELAADISFAIESLEKEDQRKRAENAMRESENRWRKLVNTIPDNIAIMDKNLTYIFLNHGEEGFSDKDVIGRSALDFITEAFRASYKDGFTSALNSGKTVFLEYDGFGDRGITRKYNSYFVPVIENEQFLYMLVLARDITEQKRAEEAIKISEERFRHISSTISDISYSCIGDENGNYSLDWMTGATEQIMGYSVGEIKAMHCWGKLVVKEDMNLFKQHVTDLTPGSSGTCELRLRQKDGGIVWLTSYAECVPEPGRSGRSVIYGGLVDISEHKAAEEVLVESEKKYRNIFENIQDVYYETSIDGTLLEISPSIEAMSKGQYRRADLLGRSMYEFYPDPKDRDAVFAAIANTGKVNDFEVQLKNRDGSLIYCSFSAKMLFNAKGQPEKIIGSMHDITERKQAELVIKVNEAMLSEAMKIALLGAWEYDVIQDQFTFNDQFYSLFHTSAEQEGGYIMSSAQYSQRFVHPDDMALVGIEIQKALEATDPGYTAKLDHRAICKNGEIKYITVYIRVQKDEQGRTVKTHGVNQDVTMRKRAEEAIEKERTLLRTLIDNLPSGIFVKDKNYRNIIANKLHLSSMAGHLSSLGLDPETDIIGKTDFEVTSREWAEKYFADDQKVIEKGYSLINQEEDGVSTYGRPICMLVSKIPLLDNDGAIVGMVGITSDITERKNAEKELIKSKEKAEESDRLKTAFLNNISHEIRTPMNAIVGFCGFLNNPELSPEKRGQFIDIILKSSDQLLSIISDIIRIAAIETGQEKINEDQIDLHSTLKYIYEQFLSKANEQNIILTLKPSLQISDEKIITDETKLVQILSNLLSNALKFTREGHVNFGCALKNNEIEFFIEDTGIGIAPEMYDVIFKRFRQVDNTNTRQYGGSGLGLSIAKAYVELLGGKIWFISELGKGTSFYFTIPYQKAPKEVLSKHSDRQSIVKIKEQKTLLIAEDEDSNFILLHELLSDLNLDILRAVNGIEAIEICKSNHIDLVLMDIKMPGMDGYQATQQIRKFMPYLPIIALTAYSKDTDKDMAIEFGCNDFISKPFKREIFISKVIRHLDLILP